MGRLTESSIVNTKNKSHALTAEVIVPASGADGVIVALGGIIGGWSLYAKGGKPKYCYNFYGVNRYTIEGDLRRSRRARIRFGWSSSTTAAGSQKAAR